MSGLEAWMTGGRRVRNLILVQCPDCEEWTRVAAETEYGASEWDKDVCGGCGRTFTGNEKQEDDDGD